MEITGNDLVGRALKQQQADTLFYIMGGPMNDALNASAANGVRLIDMRHEQAAAMAANAYARVRARPGVCAGASGPGTINLTTGLAHALVDCAPVVALGGSSPLKLYGTGSFQEIDQLAIMRPVTKWSERVYETRRIPEYIDMAFRQAMSGKPGPVYLDLPGDILYAKVDEAEVEWPLPFDQDDGARNGASQQAVEEAIDLLRSARRPIILSGSGILWSRGGDDLRAFVEKTGIPVYTTPQGRGVVPEDHEFFYGLARSTAFRNADVVLVVGTRLNYVFSYARPPRFAADVKIIRIDADPAEIAATVRLSTGIVGDAATVIRQFTATAAGKLEPKLYSAWREELQGVERQKIGKHEENLANGQVPIHPLRLCREVRDFIDRDTILVVDGQEILNYGRQSIPTYRLGHRLNSGPFGTMGVGMPFGVGAKAARPDRKVVVLHGDGSFGLNAMEVDTSMRHKLPLLIVISLNGGWTADPAREKPGRDLGYTRYEEMFKPLGCHGEYVESCDDIRPALERGAIAVANGKTAIINVRTDWRARAAGAAFTAYST